jgi:hypothetical protein
MSNRFAGEGAVALQVAHIVEVRHLQAVAAGLQARGQRRRIHGWRRALEQRRMRQLDHALGHDFASAILQRQPLHAAADSQIYLVRTIVITHLDPVITGAFDAHLVHGEAVLRPAPVADRG